jgi:hypothetical protein
MYGLAARRLASGTETSTDFDATMLQSPWPFRFRSKVLLYSPRLSEAVLSHSRRSRASLGALPTMLQSPRPFRDESQVVL